jgi:predicted acetyltransferase
MSTEIDLRPIGPDEVAEFGRAFSIAFGQTFREENVEGLREFLELDRTLAALDGSEIVGTAGVLTFELTLPGLATISAGGVTAVSVLPTHTRRGILTRVMRRQLADMRERGEALGLLYASESVIYGRFGYGLATTTAELKIETRHGAFRNLPQAGGRVRLVRGDEAATILPPIYETERRRRPGQVNRPQSWWKDWLEDQPEDRRGMSERVYVVHEGDAGPDGYLAYRINANWTAGLPDNAMQVAELITSTPDAYAALWRYALTMDLVPHVRAWGRPPDEPLRWMLADTRRLRFEALGDGLWLRIVDIPAGLSARRYLTDGAITFAVTDPFCPENTGTYRLEGGPDGAQCTRTNAEPEIALQVDDLGAAYLGGVRFTTLRWARRLQELRPGAAERADSMFASTVEPWCSHHF